MDGVACQSWYEQNVGTCFYLMSCLKTSGVLPSIQLLMFLSMPLYFPSLRLLFWIVSRFWCKAHLLCSGIDFSFHDDLIIALMFLCIFSSHLLSLCMFFLLLKTADFRHFSAYHLLVVLIRCSKTSVIRI